MALGGSWIVDRVIDRPMRVTIAIYQPLKGGSYIKIHKQQKGVHQRKKTRMIIV